MSAVRDPSTLIGQMIGQFRVGQPLDGAPSALLYNGWDYAADGASGQRKRVWLHFFDARQARDVEAVRRHVDAWRQFEHVSMLRVAGFEAEPDMPAFVAVEPSDGVFLCQRLGRQRLEIVDAVQLVLGVAAVIEGAHAAKLVHFGINEERVLVPKSGGYQPSLFGVGIIGPLSRGGLSAWHYLAREQILEESECDARADVYALGVLLYRCTTGQYPFAVDDGLGPDETAFKLTFGNRRDPRQWFEIPHARLCAVIERAVHPDRALRFQSVAEFVRALQECGLPGIELPPPPAGIPEKRAGADERTMSPTPAPETKVGAPTVGGKLRLVTPAVGHTTPTRDELVGTVLGDLRIFERIGEGGMSSIYLAKHVELGRSWVVKVAELDFAADARRRFDQEARVTAYLRERGELRVPEVRNCGKLDDGRPFMVIEYIRGETLAKLLERTPKLPLDQALKIAARVCDTLERAHNLGFTHRDIKPDNIMLEEVTGREKQKVRVIDWGVAKASGDAKRSATRPGMVIGTPGYMPVEAILGQPVDGRADVFAVACCAYQMLAGRRPFDGPNPDAITRATRLEQPTPVSSQRPGVPHELSDLLATALAKVPDARPTMAIFRERLERIMNPSSVRGAAPSNRMVTQLSTENPLASAPLSQRPTLAPTTPDDRDFIRRASAEPGPTRHVRRGKSGVRIAAVAAIVLAAAFASFVVLRFASTHRGAETVSGDAHGSSAGPSASSTVGAPSHKHTAAAPPAPTMSPTSGSVTIDKAPTAESASPSGDHASGAIASKPSSRGVAASRPKRPAKKSHSDVPAPDLDQNLNGLAPLSE